MCSNNTTDSFDFTLAEKLSFSVSYAAIFVLAIGGNATVCCIILRDLEASVTNLFLLNLSMADILMSLVVMPINATMNIWLTNWPFGALMCKVVPFTQCLTVALISLTHVVISCDRFVIVFYPMRKRISRRTGIIIIAITWLLSGLQALPMFIVGDQVTSDEQVYCDEQWSPYAKMLYSTILLVGQYFVPLLFIAGTYLAITIRLWGRSTPGESNALRDKRLAKSKRKMVKMMIVVATMYAVSQLPQHVIYFIGIAWGWCQPWLRIAWSCVVVLSASSSCYNPFIYCWMNKVYRRGFKRYLGPLLCCKEFSNSSPTKQSNLDRTSTKQEINVKYRNSADKAEQNIVLLDRSSDKFKLSNHTNASLHYPSNNIELSIQDSADYTS